MKPILYIPLLPALMLAACSSNTIKAEDHSDFHSHGSGFDLGLFYDGAVEDHSIVDCTLSDGTETSCYEITIAGYPVNHDIGPFCPETITTTADEAGIWLDGKAVYDADGAFIVSLAELYSDPNWKMYDEDGNVYITDTEEAFEAAARPDVDPAYQNHCVEGRMAWLENGEPVTTTVVLPVEPVLADRTSSGGNWGITLNGVVIAASAPVDTILSAYTIATFDDCGGHINPFDGYHLHGARGCSEVGNAEDGETPIFAYAMDGFPIHSALSSEATETANLDECNGHETHSDGYHYHANAAEKNSVLTCFKGLTVASNQGDQGGPVNGAGGAPDFSAAADQLGVTEHELQDALGMPPNFSNAAQTLGVSEAELIDALGDDLPQPPQ